jgi:hypothetical protein
MGIFSRNRNQRNFDNNGITSFIIYTDGSRYIEHLCLKNIPLAKSNIFIPNIGETFIDRIMNIEYEVKDIVRTFDGNEYGVQVQLKRREKKKYGG